MQFGAIMICQLEVDVTVNATTSPAALVKLKPTEEDRTGVVRSWLIGLYKPAIDSIYLKESL
jgi:hypothetical protein